MEIKIDAENSEDMKIDSKKETKLILINTPKKQIKIRTIGKIGYISFPLFEEQITPKYFWGKCPKCKAKNSIIGVMFDKDDKTYWACRFCDFKVPKKYRLRKDVFYIGDLRIELV